jgi:hypothetical protein
MDILVFLACMHDLCDFDLDDDIHWFDFEIFAQNYGKTAV